VKSSSVSSLKTGGKDTRSFHACDPLCSAMYRCVGGERGLLPQSIPLKRPRPERYRDLLLRGRGLFDCAEDLLPCSVVARLLPSLFLRESKSWIPARKWRLTPTATSQPPDVKNEWHAPSSERQREESRPCQGECHRTFRSLHYFELGFQKFVTWRESYANARVRLHDPGCNSHRNSEFQHFGIKKSRSSTCVGILALFLRFFPLESWMTLGSFRRPMEWGTLCNF